jgi:hypothetical protein
LLEIKQRLEQLHHFKLKVVQKLLSRFTFTPTKMDITKIEEGSDCLVDIEHQTVYLLHGDNMADEFTNHLTSFLGFPRQHKFEFLQMIKTLPGMYDASEAKL